MTTNIKPWGNSQGLYIPKEFLKQLGWDKQETVEVLLESDRIVIKKSNDLEVKKQAAERLKQLRIKVDNPNMDYREEMDKYLDERYGNV